MADNDTGMAGKPTPQANHTFGTCCEGLKEAMAGEEFEPLITVGPDGVLYMAMGLMELEDDDEPNMVDHPLFFCPFCGAKLQDPEAVGFDNDDTPTT